MNNIFYGCKSLTSLPNISKWNKDMSYMMMDLNHYYLYLIFKFGILIMLKIWIIYLMDVNDYYFYLIFQNGIMLLIWVVCLMDIHYYHLYMIFQNGIWNINNATNMSGILYGCKSLTSLPDI